MTPDDINDLQAGTAVTSKGREHSNDDYHSNHFCCPHCFDSDDYTEGGDDEDQAEVIICKNCGKLFAGWIEEIKRSASGFIQGIIE